MATYQLPTETSPTPILTGFFEGKNLGIACPGDSAASLQHRKLPQRPIHLNTPQHLIPRSGI